MTQPAVIFDLKTYPITWRFNSTDCRLNDLDKSRLVFLEQGASEKRWDLFLPFPHLLATPSGYVSNPRRFTVSFDGDYRESENLFYTILDGIDTIFFFWSRSDACITTSHVFAKGWDDFFYPSDETSILITPNKGKVIFSFEETFFVGNL